MLTLNPVHSRIGCYLAVGIRLPALFALGMVELPLLLLILLAIPIVLSLPGLPLGQRLTAAQRIHSISLGSQQCLVTMGSLQLTTAPPTVKYFSELLLVLEFQVAARLNSAGRHRLRLVLFADSLPADENRRLRRYLRFDRQAVVS